MLGYNYLLREFIAINSRENLTLNAIARRMKLTPEGLKKFLEVMEANGDLKSCSLDGSDKSASGRALKCASCLACGQCSASQAQNGKTYFLTEKAKKAFLGGI